jgi:hypothetical protein
LALADRRLLLDLCVPAGEVNLATMAECSIDGYVTAGRAKHPTDPGSGGGPLIQAMQKRS